MVAAMVVATTSFQKCCPPSETLTAATYILPTSRIRTRQHSAVRIRADVASCLSWLLTAASAWRLPRSYPGTVCGSEILVVFSSSAMLICTFRPRFKTKSLLPSGIIIPAHVKCGRTPYGTQHLPYRTFNSWFFYHFLFIYLFIFLLRKQKGQKVFKKKLY